MAKCSSAMAEQVSGGGREGFNRLWRQNEEEGSEVPKSFRWRRKISEGLIHWGRRGCRASAPFMHREGASLPCPLCNSLPLSTPFHKPWKQFCLPREPLLLDLLHSLGKESTGNTRFLFRVLRPLMGAMWVPKLSPPSPKASSGSHNSSFLRWRRKHACACCQHIHSSSPPSPPELEGCSQ